MPRLYFNRKALEAFAKEPRRASWGIAIAAAAGGIRGLEWAPPWLIADSAIAWIVLQCADVALESLESRTDDT